MGKPSRQQPIRIDYQLELHGLADPREPRSSVVARAAMLLLSVLSVVGGLTLPGKDLAASRVEAPLTPLFDLGISASPADPAPIMISNEQALGQTRVR